MTKLALAGFVMEVTVQTIPVHSIIMMAVHFVSPDVSVDFVIMGLILTVAISVTHITIHSINRARSYNIRDCGLFRLLNVSMQYIWCMSAYCI